MHWILTAATLLRHAVRLAAGMSVAILLVLLFTLWCLAAIVHSESDAEPSFSGDQAERDAARDAGDGHPAH